MSTYSIDIDGILTHETDGWKGNSYINRTPNFTHINELRQLKQDGHTIILHTARHVEDRTITEQWLQIHEVPYDKLVLDKPHADYYVDDKACSCISKPILCLSGGIDSTVAWWYLGKPKGIFFALNHKYQDKEIRAIYRLKKLTNDAFNPEIVPNLNLGNYEQPSSYIPNRNLLIASIASNYGNKIYIVGVKGDNVEDKSPLAFETMSFVLNTIRKPTDLKIEICSPFWHMTKTQIITWAIENIPNAEKVLQSTVSCYSPLSVSEHQCGACPACFRKWIALEAAGINCADWFDQDITKWSGIQQYINNLSMYAPERQTDIKKVLTKYQLL